MASFIHAAHEPATEAKSSLQTTAQMGSSLASSVSMDPKDYVWGNVNPMMQQQLSGQFMQMALMCTSFFPGSMPFMGSVPFGNCMPPPWMLPRPIAPGFPNSAPPAVSTHQMVVADVAPAATVAAPIAQQGKKPAVEVGVFANASPQKKADRGSAIKKAKSKRTATQLKTECARSVRSKCGGNLHANEAGVLTSSQSITGASQMPSELLDSELMQALEPLDLDDIRQLFSDDPPQDEHAHFSRASDGSTDTNCFHHSSSPAGLLDENVSRSLSGPLDEASLDWTAFGDGFTEHLEREYGATAGSSFGALDDLELSPDVLHDLLGNGSADGSAWIADL